MACGRTPGGAVVSGTPAEGKAAPCRRSRVARPRTAEGFCDAKVATYGPSGGGNLYFAQRETGNRDVTSKPSARRRGRAVPERQATASSGRLRNAVLSMDAEDIAMARLQAHLRRTETIQVPARPRAPMQSRTWVQLPGEMLQRLRDRARHAGVSLSDIVEAALARYLKTP